jgi:hypothetical protein
MKLLVSADYHIKLKTKNIPDTWARNRFISLFQKLRELEDTVELHIVAGDFFDKVPSLEELELYYEFVATRSRMCTTLIIPGNHEAIKKGTTFFSFLKNITERINPCVHVVDQVYNHVGIDFLPYNKLKDFEKDPDLFEFEGNILVTHVRGEIPPHVKPEVNLEIFDRWKVVLAGDLHSYDNCQRNILYPGSPVTTSFHRSPTSTGVIILDTDTLNHEFVKLDLPQLIRKTVKVGEDMVADPYHHVIYEVEGDMTELAAVMDSDLLDKKVVKRSVDTALILSPEMSIEEEITDYLTFILELPEETIEKALKVFHDNIKNTEMV